MIVVLLCFTATTVQAVMRSSQGQGEALLIPYFNTLEGNSTLLTISIPESRSKALKVHFRDTDGAIVLSFNLYLESRGSWVAAIYAADDKTALTVPDDSCVLPNLASEGHAALEETRSGFIEIIEMAEVSSSGPLHAEINQLIRNQDCDGLQSLWDSGAWATDVSTGLRKPSGGINATASIINVERGTHYGFDAIALQDFSDIVQHHSPGEPKPDLSSAHTADTDAGETTSMVCFELGCESYRWEKPIDAVASALAAFSLRDDFVTDEAIGAETEAIITFPLRYQYEQLGQAGFDSNDIDLNLFDREGKGEIVNNPCTVLIENPPCNGTYRSFSSKSVVSLVFGQSPNDEGQMIHSPIMGEASAVFFPTTEFPFNGDSGVAFLYLNILRPDSLVTADGTVFRGRPAVSVFFTEILNSNLVDDESGERVRANYGTSSAPVRDMRYQQ